MTQSKAIVLTDPGSPGAETEIINMLRFWGVDGQICTVAQILADVARCGAGVAKRNLLCSAEGFLRLTEAFQAHPEMLRSWPDFAHSAFVYAGKGSEAFQRVASILIGNGELVLCTRLEGKREVVVSEDAAFCGVMSGIRLPWAVTDCNRVWVPEVLRDTVHTLVAVGGGGAFWRASFQAVPVFLSTSGGIINLDACLNGRNFDVRPHFMSSVPIVLYVQWAFAANRWQTSEVNACLVIDDPLLTPVYGSLNFQVLFDLMKRHMFSTSLAFIPWNWRRTHPDVARLFRENTDCYSLSVHGCDHVAAEFGVQDVGALAWKASRAIERMDSHRAETGIDYDRIMVFPQGIFSKSAMSVLKQKNFLGAVNSEVISADRDAKGLTVSAWWNLAVMDYDCFPIFTRRYPTQGLENFAFDILLGKPCIIVIHQDFLCGGYEALVDFIRRLNALKCSLSWRGLGDLVRRSFRQRELTDGSVEIEMFGAELRLENRFSQRKRFRIGRRETDPGAIQCVFFGERRISWKASDGCAVFDAELDAGQANVVRMTFHNSCGNGRRQEDMLYRAKTALRRYLSEARDYHFTKQKAIGVRLGIWE